MICNLVVMPRFSPVLPLAEIVNGAPRDFVPFAASDIQFNAFVVKGNELLPRLEAHDGSYAMAAHILPAINPDRTTLFNAIGSFFKIDEKYGRDLTLAPIRKYLPETYRNAFGFAGARQGAVTDDSYFCALKEDKFKPQPPDPDRDTVNWSQVIAFCLHQPELAKQLGLLYQGIEMELPTPHYFAEGGWVYVDLKEQPGIPSSYHDLLQDHVQRYAAWIPAITESRNLFSPVLFPVEQPEATEPFDDVFDEVLRYNDGYAKIVHASQPISTDHLAEKPNGTSPVADMGIRLAWEDEQVLEWYNRGFQSMNKIAAGVSDTPLVVSRYRIDVAEIKPTDVFKDLDELETKLKTRWKSQVSVRAQDLKTDDIDLGSFDVELGVEVSPAKHGDKGNYWLPAYFANWNGTSLCLPDPLPEKLNLLGDKKIKITEDEGGDPADLPKMMYHQNAADKVDLKYGKTYGFRVRLSDISGGGPGPDTTSRIRGEHKIAIQKFKRFVAPQPPTIRPAEESLSIILERPRLNYPAILFTGVDTTDATAELLLDRQQLNLLGSESEGEPNRDWAREVSLPDPDVTEVEIVVEVKTLEMDREDSYRALKQISPKEPFIFLYKTFRKFPAYLLKHNRTDDVIDLEFSYQDIPAIAFNAPADELGLGNNIHSDNGPLILPTARDIRLTIRSFCPAEAREYFGAEESRVSIAIVHNLRQDPTALEAEPLFTEPKDSMLSLFFRPQPADSPQLRKEQKMSGKNNESDSDLLDRFASITGLVNKKGSIMGHDNIRTQFGCSAIINHSLAPDRSSITFSSRDDFYHKWINVIQLDLNRDWTWDLLKPNSFKVSREWRLDGDIDFQPREDLGGIFLTKGLNWQQMNEPDRSSTRLVFIDALDPKPAQGKFPEPIEVKYFIEPQFKQVMEGDVLTDLEFDKEANTKQLSNVLPITTPPSQVPKIISVGIALSPDTPEEVLIANRYSETGARNRYLWIEFDKPILDKKDTYFGRVLAYSPDPMLSALDDELNNVSWSGDKLVHDFIDKDQWNQDWKSFLLKEQTEPPINLDPEIVRVIRPGQPFDQSGLDAMQVMTPAITPEGESPTHFLLPLPPGIHPDSEELFGFFTYEFRVGHLDSKKWSTAQGRYGSPLRLTGVQHPAPPMLLNTMRDRDKILVSTRHAQSFYKGKNVTPPIPRTDIYACLYAQVLQADGIHYRNILIDQLQLLKPLFTTDREKIDAYNRRRREIDNLKNPFTPPEPPVLLPGTPPYAVGFWNMKNIREKLRFLGIDENASLSVLSLELMPPNDFHARELKSRDPHFPIPPGGPQDLALDKIRILRTSKLCPVTDTCAVEVE